MSTAHISASKGEIAKSILLPGDPKRAKYIADNFLEDAVLFNEVRGMLGYTGIYEGKKISVMGTGMGIPSVSIYATELCEIFGVETMIRIGTCGTFRKDISIGDLLFAQACCSDSGILSNNFPGTFAPIADFGLLMTAYKKATERGKTVRVGNLLSSDCFYPLGDPDTAKMFWKYGVLGVEMEGAGLYTVAAKYERKALAICTVSDTIENKQGMTPKEREQTLNDMIKLGLDVAFESADE